MTEVPTFRGQSAAEAASLADLPWWEVFEDPVLKDLIQEALASNYDVQIAAARVQEARAQVGVAQLAVLPADRLQLRRRPRSRNPVAAFGIPSERRKTPRRTSSSGRSPRQWELDIWGRIRRSNEAARANLLATEEARRGVWLSLVSDLAQAYFELLALDVQLQIARDSAQAFQGTYDLFQDRLRVRAWPPSSRPPGPRARSAGRRRTSRELESQIVGEGEPDQHPARARRPAPIPRGTPMYGQPVVPDGAGRVALHPARSGGPTSARPSSSWCRANAQVGVAKAEFFPKLNLTGSSARRARRCRRSRAGARWCGPSPRD